MSDAKEALSDVNRLFPNFNVFIKVVLKREILSEDAECIRARYEGIISAMEDDHAPPRPISLIGDDDSGYHSTKPKGIIAPELIPTVTQSGYLLKRDDKYRWHRYWCRLDSRDMKFLIFSDSHEETLIKSVPLKPVSASFGTPQSSECDKENCFVLCGIADDGEESGSGLSEEIVFAAYSDVDYHQWRSALSILTGTRESMRMSSGSLLEGSHWGTLAPGHDAASTSSSNISSNRASMISTTSSLHYTLKPPNQDSPPRGHSPMGQTTVFSDTSTLSSKQLQPLPSPPAEGGEPEDDDTASVGTIYENIDNLVSQFDSTMQATVQAMGQLGQHLGNSKKHRKKERSLLRQASLLKGSKGKARLSEKQKGELEKGEHFSGNLYKRGSNGSWKKKWCVLKGAVLSYSKNMDDLDGREYVVLDARLEKITDPKKSFAFTIHLRGVPEPLYFGSDDESIVNEWITKLESASISKRDFSWDMCKAQDSDDQSSRYHSQTSLDSTELLEGHYNIPRAILPEAQGSGVSSYAGDAINNGIYSVPSSLPILEGSNTFSVQGQSFSLSSDPYAQYDVPRPVSLVPDEEAIYDYPENLVDMEIYDYPPDAITLLPPPPDMCPLPPDNAHSSMSTLSSEFTFSARSSAAVSEDWSSSSSLLPPPPVSLSSSRPSMAVSTASSEEYLPKSSRNSVASIEGMHDRPRSNRNSSALNRSSIGEILGEQFSTISSADIPEASSEFGTCAVRGCLYKKERFTWTKMDCLIRNSFLECHKPSSNQGPALKLFLPRSVVSPDKEAKRQWAIKIRHPRRDGILQLAAETQEEYNRWMNAFRSAAAIEVQSVNTVDEIRITDLDMQNRWTTLERNTPQLPPPTETKKKVLDLPPISTGRRNTYSAGDEYMTDTLKRRKKFSWIKTLSRKRGLHHTTVSDASLATDKQHLNGALVKQRLDPQPASTPVAPEDRAHHVTTDGGVEQFQGYLHVQRKGASNTWVRYWCVLEDLTISCFVSRSDLVLTLSIQLKGSRVADATLDCKRQCSFKIWHLESGQCLFFAADDGIEYGSWFKEVTKDAEYVVPLDAGISNSPLAAPFYHYTKESPVDSSPSQRSSRSSIASLPELDLDTTPVPAGGTAIYKGNLKKLTQNKWKDRYCVIKDSALQVFATSTERTLLATMPLSGAGVELVNVPKEEVHHFTFRLCVSTGKSHMFCAVSEQEMYVWATTLQDVANQSSDSKDDLFARKRKVSSSALKHIEKLYTTIPAPQLSNAVYAGYTEMLALGSWERYWCVIHSGALYLYPNHESQATTLTIILKGYSVTVGGPRGCKKPCVISLQHPGLHTTFMSVLDQNQLNVWFNALEQGTRMENTIQHLKKSQETTGVSGKDVRVEVTPCDTTDPPQLTNTRYKSSGQQEQPSDITFKKGDGVPQQVVRKYEKKVRKTHRVANMTEQNLKRQQSSLMHFKRELSQTTGTLEELADKGDEHAIKRLKSIRVKLQQIEKVLPYINKYIMVNRQAEIQTVAILKESCTVDLQKLRGGASSTAGGSDDLEYKMNSTQLETHAEEAEIVAPVQLSPETVSVPTAEPQVSSAIPDSLNEAVLSRTEPAEPPPPAPLSSPELDQQITSEKAKESPYANLETIQAEVDKYHEEQEEKSEAPTESPYATLASIRPGGTDASKCSDDVHYAELVQVRSPPESSPSTAPKSPYAELDFTRMQQQSPQQPVAEHQPLQQRLTPTSPRSRLNYVEVSFNPNKSKAKIVDETDSKDGDVTLVVKAGEENSELDVTVTAESQTLRLGSPPPPAASPKLRVAAMQEAIKLFEPAHSSTPTKPLSNKSGPPPVKKKPKQTSSSANRSSLTESTPSPSHTSSEHTDNKANTSHSTDETTSDEVKMVATGTLSVMERIKVLQQKGN